MNVSNHQIKISDNCPKNIKESIYKYWKFDNDEFLNKPRNIAKSLKIETYEVSNFVSKNSQLDFNICCDRCNQNILHTVFSQAAYNKITRKPTYTCPSCLATIAKNKQIEEERIRQEKMKRFKDAITNKHWENLNRYEFIILHNIVFEKNYDAFLKKYENKKSNYFWEAIVKLKKLYLIELEFDSYKNEIKNIHYLDELTKTLPAIEENEENKIKDTSFNNETNELKFRLTKNPNPYSYDSPEYSGVLEFHQTVVLKPGIEYSFGAWKKQNDVLYLSIIPTKDKPLLPKQKNKAW